jgi:hypothetical protein
MSSIDYKCEFCGDFTSSKSNLDRHQKTKKKCIEIQKTKGLQVKDPLIKCQYCDKKYNILSMKGHAETCTVKKERSQLIGNNINIGTNSGNIHIEAVTNVNLGLQ